MSRRTVSTAVPTGVTTRRRTALAALAVAAVGALVVSGCGDQDPHPRIVDHPASEAATAPQAPARQAAALPARAVHPVSATPRREAEPVDEVPVENVPTELPPGDPGLDAPSVPDPGVPGHDHGHGQARTQVPGPALLDAASVAAALGGRWQPGQAQPPEGFTATEPVAVRTVAYDADGGRVEETVATHPSLAAADRAVSALGRELADRGWARLPNPRLGTASAAVRSPDGSRTAVIMSAEGVTATLVGSGTARANRGRWTGLLDLALGTSCAAAPEGCH